jgi:hypothetical protein
LILYGVIAEVSIDHLFRAGILPGILMIAVLAGWSAWVNRGNKQMIKPFSWKELAGALGEAKWELPLPFVVLGGIYSGFLAVSDAAAITALYVFVVEVLILREIRFNELPQIIRSSMVLVGGILIILSVSLASTNYMISAGIPQMLLEFVAGMVSSQVTFLFIAAGFPADSGRDTRYFFRDRTGRAADTADCSRFRRAPGAPWNCFSRSDGAGIPDTSGGSKSLYFKLPIRKADNERVLSDISIPDHTDAICNPDRILAGSVALARA